MNLLEAYCLTPAARDLFNKASANIGSQNDSNWLDRWFNWEYVHSYAERDAKRTKVRRIEVLSDQATRADLVAWAKHCISANYAPRFISAGFDERVLPPELNVPHAALNPYHLQHAYELGLGLSEPDEFFLRDWGSITLGGGVPFLGPSNVSSPQWRAYALGLREWFHHSLNVDQVSDRYPNFNVWEKYPEENDGNYVKRYTQIPPEDFVWPEEGCATYHPGTEHFIPHRFMPCCGIYLDTDSKPQVLGVLSDGWEFDEGCGVRNALRALATNAAIVPRNQSASRQSRAALQVQAIVETAELFARIRCPQIKGGTSALTITARTDSAYRLYTNTFFFDEGLRETVSKVPPVYKVKLNLEQRISTHIVPTDKIFTLTTRARISGPDDGTYSMGVQINDILPTEWFSLIRDKTIYMRTPVQSGDRVEYLLRKDS